MRRAAAALDAIPRVQEALERLQDEERGLAAVRSRPPAHPLVRAALRASVDHSLNNLDAIRCSLKALKNGLR
jgi:hypothetical protein